MFKKIKFYNFLEDNDKICEGILVEDHMFSGGYKILYENCIFSIKIVKIVED
jgi:hypothetical protein